MNVLELAREAGFRDSNQPKIHILGGEGDALPELERFAALVRAATLEKLISDGFIGEQYADDARRAINGESE